LSGLVSLSLTPLCKKARRNSMRLRRTSSATSNRGEFYVDLMSERTDSLRRGVWGGAMQRNVPQLCLPRSGAQFLDPLFGFLEALRVSLVSCDLTIELDRLGAVLHLVVK